MLRGVLFDLDGTLLDIEQDEFFARYFEAVTRFASPHFPGIDILGAIRSGTGAMMQPHPGRTNHAVFADRFEERTGVAFDRAWPIFERFYREVFPTLGDGFVPMPGAREAIEAARALGLQVAVATQPLFPITAIEHRLAWAGLGDVGFDAITTYETMLACKPQNEYFAQTAKMIGCAPGECLMIGDDAGNDLPASKVGMRTFYVGSAVDAVADFSGDMNDVPDVLARLVEAR